MPDSTPLSKPKALVALLVDDHPIFRRGLREILATRWPGIEIVECGTASEAQTLLPSRSWSLVVLDQSLPDGVGTDLIADPWASRTLVFSMHDDPHLVRLCRLRGAGGFLCKAESPERIESALELVLGGESLPATVRTTPPLPSLSERERLVLKAILTGKRPQSIAHHLGLSRSAVQSYKERVFKKLEVDSLPELVRRCAALGLD